MDTGQPKALLLRDHAEIEVLLQDLLVAFDGGDRSLATSAFQALDRRLSAHLAFEEEMLLPALAAIDPREADEISAQHRTIRARVEMLAVADNLHLSRANEVHEVVEMLRAHARHEERTLYGLADRLADQPALHDRLDDLLGVDRPPAPSAP
jgi:hypothetical protein